MPQLDTLCKHLGTTHIPWPEAPQCVSLYVGDFPANLKYWIIRAKLSKNPLPSHLQRLSLMDPNPRQVDNRNSILKHKVGKLYFDPIKTRTRPNVEKTPQ